MPRNKKPSVEPSSAIKNDMLLVDAQRFKLMSLDMLVKADWNYKEEDEERAAKLKRQIQRNGQIENIIVRPLDTGYYEVVNGNHRLDIFNDLEIKEVMVYDCGDISLVQAMRISIETNETKFETNQLLLAERVTDILNEFSLEELVETMPYSLEELEAMPKLKDFDWEQFKKPEGEGGEGDGKGSVVSFLLEPEEMELWLAVKDKFGKEIKSNKDTEIFVAILNSL
jgi:hypothetical protein